MSTKLYIVIPCYNEEAVLPISVPLFHNILLEMIHKQKISSDSRILLVNDGSTDQTWNLIKKYSEKYDSICGISLSRNRGHQNALLAGLIESKQNADIVITIDCDGQDDIEAMEDMIDAYHDGCDIVYGVRSKRKKDSFFKQATARLFYKLMGSIGAEIIENHADYRLLSARVIHELEQFKESNLFLRGMIPLVGFKSTSVYYERKERLAGETKYSLNKMVGLAFNGITSFSIEPLRMIMATGALVALLSFIGVIWAVVTALTGNSVAGWASMTCIICFVGGVQLICLGVLGEYIGKIYLEVKDRPKFIISDRTENMKER